MGHQLTWSHYRELLPIKDLNEIIYYINICISKKLAKRELVNKIKSKEYERLDENTKKKLYTRNIITKKNNLFIIEYCSDPRIYNTTYELV